MSDYSKVNLEEVEDSAPKFGFAPDLSARFAGRTLGAERIGLSLERLAPNKRAPFGHRHEKDEEIYVVVSGSGRLKIEEEIVDVAKWDAIRVPAHAARQFEAGPDGLEVLAFGESNTTDPSAPDGKIMPGWWSD